MQTRVIGEPAIWSNFQDVSKKQLARGEAIGFPLILLILLAGFGTLVAAVAPLALGFAAVFLTGAAIYGLSRSFEISVYVTNMASMIGIGVAVDYSLFIVSRFRRELHAGADKAQALARAMSSSGTAVVFSGATVAVSLAALFAIDVNALRSMAVGAIVVVCISVLASITLLPAMLAAVGTRVDRFRLPLPWRTSEAGSDAFWSGWARRVMRRPVAGFAVGAGFMLVLAIPFFWMQTFNRGLDELPQNAEVRVATEHAQALDRAGLRRARARAHARAARRARARSRAVPGVARVAPPVREPSGRQWLTDVTLAVPVESSAARDVVHRIQAVAGPEAIARRQHRLRHGRDARDLRRPLEDAARDPRRVLRRALRAAAQRAAAAEGGGDEPPERRRGVRRPRRRLPVGLARLDGLRTRPGYVETIVPALVLAVTFGLSMDYEVFLLTRIRERWLEHGDNERAVAEGLTLSARIITSAALVMVAVFFAFVVAGAPSLKELGTGLGVAILLDATIVRLLIVPAAMRLLGRLELVDAQPFGPPASGAFPLT